MSKKTKTGGPAFPTETIHKISSDGYIYEGMTMRDYFAAQALTGILANTSDKCASTSTIASCCYEFADAMLKARGE